MKSTGLILFSLVTSVAAFSSVQPVSFKCTTYPRKFLDKMQLFAEQEGATSVLEKELTQTKSIVSIDTTTDALESNKEMEEEMSETQKLMKQVKDAGTAGIISYALWEFGFWAVSVPVVLFGYVSLTGHFPDLSNKEDTAKLGAEAFAFVNFARFAVPLRIGLALSTTPWIQSNIVDRFLATKAEEETS